MHYIDTSATLNPELTYYYMVKSENLNRVQSKPSSSQSVQSAKTRMVRAPQQVEWRYLDDGTMMLFWEDLLPSDPFVTKYLVAVTDSLGSNYQLIPRAEIDPKNTAWLQGEKRKAGTWYCVLAEDKWGNRSACHPVQPRKEQITTKPGVIQIQQSGKQYMLTWAVPTDKNVEAIRLYETVENEKPVLIKTFEPTSFSYVIPMVKGDHPKSYFLTYWLKDGKESERGDAVLIKK
jgi:hypothetical protein